MTPALALLLVFAGPADPPGLDELYRRGAWDGFLETATVESERFRQTLLTPAGGDRPAERLARRAAAFLKAPAVRRRVAGDGFGPIAPADLLAGIEGFADGRDLAADYAPFAGRWFGRWDGTEVDHHWAEYAPLDPPRIYKVPGGEIRLLGVQYAWVGDGYGANLLAERDGKQFLLGYVVHAADETLAVETARRPHVGVPLPGGGLAWVAPGGVYFERVFSPADGAKRYAVTGFEHATEGDELTIRRAFRAVYARDPAVRPAWDAFALETAD